MKVRDKLQEEFGGAKSVEVSCEPTIAKFKY